MAIKKPEPKSPPTGLELLVFILLLTAIVPAVVGFFTFSFSPIGFLLGVRNYFAPFFEKNLVWLEIFSVILSALFLGGIIYVIFKTNYLEIKKEQLLDILGQGYVSKRRSLKGWRQIQARLQASEQNQWKLAILEADHMLNEILKMSGYLGKDLEDKLELITPAQLSNVEEVQKAHQVRGKIAQDPAFAISREEALEVIEVYKKSFVELNLIRE